MQYPPYYLHLDLQWINGCSPEIQHSENGPFTDDLFINSTCLVSFTQDMFSSRGRVCYLQTFFLRHEKHRVFVRIFCQASPGLDTLSLKMGDAARLVVPKMLDVKIGYPQISYFDLWLLGANPFSDTPIIQLNMVISFQKKLAILPWYCLFLL